MYIFIDESGDLGFNKMRGSKFFVVCAIKIDDKKTLYRIIKRHRERYLKKKYKEKSEVKFSNTSKENRRRILEDIKNIENLEIFSIIIDKRNAYEYVKKDSPIRMHAFLLKILIEKCCKNPIENSSFIVIDRCFSKSQQDTLRLYLETQNENLLNSTVEILHEKSEKDSGIMCVDFIVGAIFSKYERENISYYDIIKPKIMYEKQIY